VCLGEGTTLDSKHAIARAFEVEPDRSKPMPYRYGFVRSVTPNYLRIPSKEEQSKYEFGLDRHLRNYRKLRDKWDELDVGANDVPLDERGEALGRIPDHALPLGESERFGGDGKDEVPWWLEGGRRISNLTGFKAPPKAAIAGRVKRHAGIAFIDTFLTGEAANSRRFAITTDGRLLAADKVKANSGSPFHGLALRDVSLPMAFVWQKGAKAWTFDGPRITPDATLEWRQPLALSGEVKQVDDVRWVQTKDGRWLKSDELRIAARPSVLPAVAKTGAKWIDISIFSQTMVLWEGERPVYATLVSTGRDGVGDPAKTLSTPQGTFRIYQKHVTTTMDSNAADKEFELRDVPWVMYFKGGYALHTAYWHDDFGEVRSHGCVNISPIDARYVFLWSAPSVPEHWHAVNAEGAFEEGTVVVIHP